MPDRREPDVEAIAGLIEDRPGGRRGLPPAFSTEEEVVRSQPVAIVAAGRALEAVRPAQVGQVEQAGALGRKETVELRLVPRVVAAPYGSGHRGTPLRNSTLPRELDPGQAQMAVFGLRKRTSM